MTEADSHAWANFLCTRPSSLYMLVDAAHDHTCPAQLRAQGLEVHSLFSGLKEITLAEVAPYLVTLPKQRKALEPLLQKHWGHGKCWSVIVESSANPKTTRQQLKKILTVELENGAKAYFRFYDGRALEKFIAISSVKQMDEVFGDVLEEIYYTSIEGVASLMSLRRIPESGWKALTQNNNYKLIAHHRKGDVHYENIEQSTG